MNDITSDAEWRLQPVASPQRGDILIKRVFHPTNLVERAIVGMQERLQVHFDAGHSSSEHAAVCIAPLFVAEAVESGIVANSLVTADRARTKYLVYRHSRPAIGELAAQIAESVARGRNQLVYNRATRTTGGGYKLAGAAASLFSDTGIKPVTERVETWPNYVLNLVRYFTDNTYFSRDWAYCSMFVCGCFEAAALLENDVHSALRVNPAMVSPKEYEHRLENHSLYRRVGRYIYQEDIGNHARREELFQKIRQAVEDYHATHRGGGLLGAQALKAKFGLRSVSPESQRALTDLDRYIRVCQDVRKVPGRFDIEVELLYLYVLYFIGAKRDQIAPIGFSDSVGLWLDEWEKTDFKRVLASAANLGSPLRKGSTFHDILTKFNTDLLREATRRANRLAVRLP